MENKLDYIKKLTISFLLICLFFSTSIVEAVIILLLNIDYNALNTTIQTIISLAIRILILVVMMLPFKNELKNSFKDFIQNKDLYFKKYFKYWLLLMAIMMASNLFINYLKGDATSTATNEAEIRKMFTIMPVYIYTSSVLIAPIMEELIFRRCVKTFFNNKYLYIIASGLFFGAVHLMTGLESIVDILYIIPYSVPGIIFAYLYIKSNNIIVPISMHLMHNGIQMSMQTLLLILT